MTQFNYRARLVVALLWLFFTVTATAQTTQFTYQGFLTDGGNPANGVYDLQFKLFSALSAGAQQGTTVSLEDVPASNGIFKVTLDFGAPAFPGADRFLEISVRPGISTGAYITLAPRQQLTSSPYAIRTLSAAAADSLSAACVNCVTSGQIASVAGNQVTGTLPVAAIPAGSGNYVQNATSQQSSSNFNISGDGTVGGTLSGNVVNATTQFNLNGTRILTKVDTNLIAGETAGSILTTGTHNAFFGYYADAANTAGLSNTFIGSEAGKSNFTTGKNVNEGSWNTFIGRQAGTLNSIGYANTFVGSFSGQSNQSGVNNSFFGERAGLGNTTGANNSFFGQLAGFNNTTGSNNVFLGNRAGQYNTTGSNNLYLGANAGGSTNFLINATAIGANAAVDAYNTMVLGSIKGVNGATEDVKVGIGTQHPYVKLHVTTSHANDTAIIGDNSGIGGYGVAGSHLGFQGTGVYGRSQNYVGVAGASYGTSLDNYGVLGYSQLGTGVFGTTDGDTAFGVHGLNFTGTGVYGSTDTGTGVYGRSFTTNGFAGFFAGYLYATVIIKGAGSFKIDHPLDPENKYLSHSFVESPDMKNIYDGVVSTDDAGTATVTLPDYFEALNRDFRYQLTVIGDFAQAFVASKIKNNRFSIKTDKPNIEVSWQVTGIRQDAFANANRIPNVEDKTEKERGYYLHPEAFGQPEEKGVEWAKNPELMKRMKEDREHPRPRPTNPIAAPTARPNNN